MLAIRMQRTGRKGQAMFRVVVQNSRQTPSSGRVVAQLGNYNPHSKVANLDKEKVSFYLEHGAQPSDRTARLFQKEGVKLPSWVTLSADGSRATRKPEKLRKNNPAEAPVEEPKTEAAVASDEAPAEEVTLEPAETAEVAADKPEAEATPSEEPKA